MFTLRWLKRRSIWTHVHGFRYCIWFTLVFIDVTYISEIGSCCRHHLTRQFGHRVFAREDLSLHHVAQQEAHHRHGLMITTRTRHRQHRSPYARGMNPVEVWVLPHMPHGLLHDLEKVPPNSSLLSVVREERCVFMHFYDVVFVDDTGEQHVIPYCPY